MRLSKREVVTVNTRVLNTRYCELVQKAERVPAKDISVAEAQEILLIEEELHQRLVKQMGRDPYPPDRIEKEAPSNYMISLLTSRKSPPDDAGVVEKVELEKKTEGKLGFKIIIKSSIGSIVATHNVKVDSRNQADIMAVTMIEQLGLKKATYKIS